MRNSSIAVIGSLVENVLAEKKEIVVPLGGVMSISVHVPDMRDGCKRVYHS